VRVETALGAVTAEAGFLDVDGRGGFAWHHRPSGSNAGAGAIVLCPPLGYEQLSSYRTWRILAERLASAGFHAVRLDYLGTGNSEGDAGEADEVDSWIRSIDAAVAHARRLAECEQVALVGLRAGALLALQAARRSQPIDRLVLWSPFASGRACVRELRALARLSRQEHGDEDAQEEAEGLNVAGYVMSAAALAALARWSGADLIGPLARQTLVVDAQERPVDPAFLESLRATGTALTRIHSEETADMLAPPHRAKTADGIIDAVTAWFADWTPPAVRKPTAAKPGGCALARHLTSAYEERPVRFGGGERLFGLLTRPRRPSVVPSIILLNTGVEHHIGPHRLYVPLARRWAAEGHHVLRFDLGGIGDSTAAPGAPENMAYPPAMLDDAREAVEFVRRAAPERPVVMAGLCAGGWLAFRAARDGLAVDAIVSVNPPLYLRDGVVGKRWRSEVDELRRYQQVLRDPSRWAGKLLRRSSYVKMWRLASYHLAARFGGGAASARLGRVGGTLARDLETIERRGIETLFLFSRGDKGLEYFEMHAGQRLRQSEASSRIHHVVIDGAGHSFRPSAAQRALSDRLVAFVEAVTRAASQSR
jgi:alpha-beta hydrolase superfamily lysophospholipase